MYFWRSSFLLDKRFPAGTNNPYIAALLKDFLTLYSGKIASQNTRFFMVSYLNQSCDFVPKFNFDFDDKNTSYFLIIWQNV